MIQVYIADTAALSHPETFRHYMDRIDESRREKVWKCRKEEDRKRSLLAGYLIQVGMKERCVKESGELADTAPLSLSYAFGENGKPYVTDYPQIKFSLSHSENYVVAAFAEEEIGIDIQYCKELRFDMAERFFSLEDKELLSRLGEMENDAHFYRMWTIKEAYMKLTGEGLRQGLDRTFIVPDVREQTVGRIYKKDSRESAYYKLCNSGVEKYSIAVCSYSQISDIKIKEVVLADEKL